MKNLIFKFVPFLLLIYFNCSVFACINSLGSLELSNSEVECIDHSGTVKLINIKIKKNYLNSGKSNFQNVFVESIKSSGSFNADNLTADFYTGSGAFYGDKVNIKNIINSGTFVAKKLICDDFKGNGNFKGYSILVNNFNNDGAVKFEENSTINGKIYIKGNFFASNSTFNKAIFVESNKVKITNKTKTKEIIIKKSSFSFFNKKYVYIDNSTVNGDILFEDGNGTVIIENNGKLNGKIYGGILKKM
nr:hypothetical protein GTC16762_29260 [Pigmentibacter ruber]